MQGRRIIHLFLAAGMIFFTAFLVGCGGEELSSTWRDHPVVIDGVDAEWEGAVAYIDEKNVAIGLLNDEEYIHVCLATVDFEVVQQILSSGLTVWFDAKGGKEKTFGINFPLGMQFSQENMDRDKKNRESMPSPMSRGERPDPEEMWKRAKESEKEMVIIGPEEGRRYRVPIVGSQEIQVRLDYSQGKLVYEMRVPLIQDAEHPDAIGLDDGQFVGVGFEVANMAMNKMRAGIDSGGQGMGRGGRGGDGMRGGGKRGGGKSGGREPNGGFPEPLELWTKVQLAVADSAEQL